MLKKLIVISALVLVGARALAMNFVIGNMCFEVKSKDEHTVSLVLCWTKNEIVDIPEIVTWQGQDYQVIDIAPLALRNSPAMKQLNVPKTCANIHAATFYYSSLLERVNVADDNEVYSDVDGVLYSKDRRTLYLYPQGRQETTYHTPEGVTVIADNAFFKCRMLKALSFPQSLTRIGQSAFAGCHALREITISEHVTEIGSYAFYDCLKLLSVKILGKEAIKLGEHVFSYSTYINGELLLRKDASSALTDKFRKSGFSNIIFY